MPIVLLLYRVAKAIFSVSPFAGDPPFPETCVRAFEPTHYA